MFGSFQADCFVFTHFPRKLCTVEFGVVLLGLHRFVRKFPFLTKQGSETSFSWTKSTNVFFFLTTETHTATISADITYRGGRGGDGILPWKEVLSPLGFWARVTCGGETRGGMLDHCFTAVLTTMSHACFKVWTYCKCVRRSLLRCWLRYSDTRPWA